MIPHTNELVIDLFACGGGASEGLRMAGIKVDIAVNHDPVAVAIHKVNHPYTYHYCQDVRQVDPRAAAAGRPLGLLWASPDCTTFSRAKGGAPIRNVQSRELANDIINRWIPQLLPRIIMMENVPEFVKWGPVDENGVVIKSLAGTDYNRFISKLRGLGYAVEWRNIKACIYGAPTSRERWFLIARRDGEPIVWPEATHGPGLIPYRTAADIIDFSLPVPSIFLTKEQARKYRCKRPLAEATMKRLAYGIKRFLIDTDDPFIVDEHAFATVNLAHGDKGNSVRTADIREPVKTIHAGGGNHALVCAFLSKYYGGVIGIDARKPFDTITAWDHHALVAASVCKLRGDNIGTPINEPVQTISAGGNHHAIVNAFLVKYYGTSMANSIKEPLGTVTARDRFGLVYVKREPYIITDIGLRMFTPTELYLAQGFREDYVFDIVDGRKLTKSQQVYMCGNSVPPPVPYKLASDNVYRGAYV